nr:hypothetical protein [Tanacetum cinerariifolium]
MLYADASNCDRISVSRLQWTTPTLLWRNISGLRNRRRGKVYNWETAMHASEAPLLCEPTVSSLNDEIDFRVSYDEFDDEDYMVVFDKNLFSYNVDKDKDPTAGSDQRMKRQKTSKDANSSKEQDMGNTDDQPDVKAASKHEGFKKPERPPTLDSDWNVGKTIDFRPPQTWISKITQAEKPPLFFDELMSMKEQDNNLRVKMNLVQGRDNEGL